MPSDSSSDSNPLISRFLPSGFDPSQRLGLVAGRGIYPMLMARNILRHRIPLSVYAIEGDADRDWIHSLPGDIPKHWLNAGQLGKLLRSLKQDGCSSVVMAGQVSPGKLFRGLHPDFKALQLLLRVKLKNADSLFGAVAGEMEREQIKLLDARAFMDDQLASLGEMTGTRSSVPAETVQWAGNLARTLAGLDVGQSIVVSKGTIIAVEAYEGTDAMIERAGQIGAPSMVLVKAAKPGKDMRFDVPVFGERTLRKMQAAGIRAALLEADSTIMLNKESLLKQAHAERIRIAGF
jgi:DUF1009 family protein